MTAVENGAGGQHFIDADVLAERELTEKQLPQDVGIKVMHLEKLFPPRPRCPPKLAVADLSFHVKYNEVFGLLGKYSKSGRERASRLLESNCRFRIFIPLPLLQICSHCHRLASLLF